MKKIFVVILGLAGLLCLGAIGPEVWPGKAGSIVFARNSSSVTAAGASKILSNTADSAYNLTSRTAGTIALSPSLPLVLSSFTVGVDFDAGYENGEKFVIELATCDMTQSPASSDCTVVAGSRIVFYDPESGHTPGARDVACQDYASGNRNCTGVAMLSVTVSQSATRDLLTFWIPLSSDADWTAESGTDVNIDMFARVLFAN